MAIPKNREAYERLREMILSGEIEPGERLSLRPTAQRLGMSVGPVQEAIRRLEQEKLVETHDRWGSRVSSPSLEGIREGYVLRRALECEAARLACENMDEAMGERLTALARRLDGDESGEDGQARRRDRVETDYQLHLAIAQASGVRPLLEALQRRQMHDMLWRNNVESAGAPMLPHAPLVEALTRADPQRAEDAMRAHITEAMELHLRALRLGRMMAVGEKAVG